MFLSNISLKTYNTANTGLHWCSADMELEQTRISDEYIPSRSSLFSLHICPSHRPFHFKQQEYHLYVFLVHKSWGHVTLVFIL